MARLPVPGSDKGTWGEVLNDFLLESHQPNGRLKPNSVATPQLEEGAVTERTLAADAVTERSLADDAVTRAKLKDAGTPGNVALLNDAGDATNAAGQTLLTTHAANAAFVVYLRHDGTPLKGSKIVAVTLTEDETDIDNIAVYDSIEEVG